MKVSRLHLVIAAVMTLSLVLSACAFADITQSFQVIGPNTVSRTALIPSGAAIDVSTRNKSNSLRFGVSADYPFNYGLVAPGGSIFDIVTLGDTTPGDATFSVRLVRVPTAVFPTDYCAIAWTNSAAGAGLYDIYTLRTYSRGSTKAVGGQIKDIIATGTAGLHPTATTDPPQYKYALVYQPTSTDSATVTDTPAVPASEHQGRLRVTIMEARAGSPNFLLVDKIYDDKAALATTSALDPGVRFTGVAGNATQLKIYAELRHDNRVPALLTSVVNTVVLPSDQIDNATLATSSAPTDLTWGEFGTPRAVTVVTATNNGQRPWAANSTKILAYNATDITVTGAPYTIAAATAINATASKNFQLRAPARKSGRYAMRYKLQRVVTNYQPGSLDVAWPSGHALAGSKDLDFPTTAPYYVETSIDVSRFADMELDASYRTQVEMLATAGVTLGTQVWDPTIPQLALYSPNLSVDRQQMAAFLGRAAKFWVASPTRSTRTTNPRTSAAYTNNWNALGLPPTAGLPPSMPTGSAFTDISVDPLNVGPGQFFVPIALAAWIEAAYAPSNWGMPAGTPQITAGCVATPLQYCPTALVTREQMAAFIRRTFEIPRVNPATPSFTDVPNTRVLFQDVEGIASLQLNPYPITRGCSATTFCPTDPVSRLQMAIFLIRAGTAPNPEPAASLTTDAPLP